jgi:hypothetical protein
MSASKVAAKAWLDRAQGDKGFSVEVRAGGSIVSITRTFDAGSVDKFGDVEFDAHELMQDVPASGGSVWGSDGVGAYVAIKQGVYVRHISGVKKRFSTALAKELGQ